MVQRLLTGQPNDLLKVVLPAASRGDLEAVKAILRSKRDWVFAIGPHNRTMLWEAARKGRLDVVKYLLKRGADINAAGCYYSDHFVDISCVCVARYHGHPEVADHLVEIHDDLLVFAFGHSILMPSGTG